MHPKRSKKRLIANKRLVDLVARHVGIVLSRPDIASAVFPDPSGPTTELLGRIGFRAFAEAVVAGQTRRCPRCGRPMVVTNRGSLPSGSCAAVLWLCPACGKETWETMDAGRSNPAWRYPIRAFRSGDLSSIGLGDPFAAGKALAAAAKGRPAGEELLESRVRPLPDGASISGFRPTALRAAFFGLSPRDFVRRHQPPQAGISRNPNKRGLAARRQPGTKTRKTGTPTIRGKKQP